jgi:hypothetical protein
MELNTLFTLPNYTVDPHYSDKTQCVPFHGDIYTINYISTYLNQADIFIETGTAYADSSHYVAFNFPNMPVYTDEPWSERYDLSRDVLKNYPNVFLSKTTSPDFFKEIEELEINLFDKTAVFWLDAHGDWTEPDGTRKFAWPLPQEVDYITKNFKKFAIFIDDFYNPYNNKHKYDEYRIPSHHLICGPDMVRPSLNGAKLYHLNHDEVTSKMQPFVVGVGLVTNMELLESDEPIVENTGAGYQDMFVYRT